MVLTSDRIQNHRVTFALPSRPLVSSRCQHLIASLIQDPENRLCSQRYRYKDMQQEAQCASSAGNGNSQDFTDRFVFPYDAEDIKAHKWFKGVPWERLHELDPPFVPVLRSADDTQYFEDDEPIENLSDSDDDDDDEVDELALPDIATNVVDRKAAGGLDGAAASGLTGHKVRDVVPNPRSLAATTVNHAKLPMTPPSSMPPSPAREAALSSPTPKAPATPAVAPAATVAGAVIANAVTNATKKRAEREARLAKTLEPFDCGIQAAVRSWLRVPYDSLRLRHFEIQVDEEPGLRATERDTLKALVRLYGKKEKKRPRDRLLRDSATKRAALGLRKKMAFIGYDWKRMQAQTQPQLQALTMRPRVASPGPTSTASVPIETLAGRYTGHTLTPYASVHPPPGFGHLAPLGAISPGRTNMG